MRPRDDQSGSWRSIGEVAAKMMSDLAQERKLDMIAALTAGEVDGWRAELRTGHRPPFPGETVALAIRERQLGRRA